MKVTSHSGGLLEQLVAPGEFRAVLQVNYHRYRPGEEHEVHDHADREEVFVCTSGRGQLIGETSCPVSRGSVVVVPPNQPHGFVSDLRYPLEYFCIACALRPGRLTPPETT